MGILDWFFGSGGGGVSVVNRNVNTPHYPKRPRVRFVNGKPIREVRRNSRQLWQEKGWTIAGEELRGFYRTRYGSHAGFIRQPFSSTPEFFIIDPPEEVVVYGPHAACFRERKNGVYSIHFWPKPHDVNTGILRVEHCILESMG